MQEYYLTMLNTDYKIVVIPTHSDVKGMPPRNQYNRHIDILVKAKTMKRCMKIYGQITGWEDYKFTNYNKEMGHNQSDNEKYIELVNDYEECVMYCLDWVFPHKFILFDGFENKLRDKNSEKIFKLDIPDGLKDVMENGIHFDKLLKQ